MKDYHAIELPDGKHLERCPVCGSGAALYLYGDPKSDTPCGKVVCCTNNVKFGPQEGIASEGCLLFLPPLEFYHHRKISAIEYWNAYSIALVELRSKT